MMKNAVKQIKDYFLNEQNVFKYFIPSLLVFTLTAVLVMTGVIDGWASPLMGIDHGDGWILNILIVIQIVLAIWAARKARLL